MGIRGSWSQKIQKTVKLKELDEFGTFFKNVIHSLFLCSGQK